MILYSTSEFYGEGERHCPWLSVKFYQHPVIRHLLQGDKLRANNWPCLLDEFVQSVGVFRFDAHTPEHHSYRDGASFSAFLLSVYLLYLLLIRSYLNINEPYLLSSYKCSSFSDCNQQSSMFYPHPHTHRVDPFLVHDNPGWLWWYASLQYIWNILQSESKNGSNCN